MTDQEIRENPANIKSLLRRIASNSVHPDPYKRLSSVLCFNRVFSVIREYEPLVDRFCLEITHQVLGSLKMCYQNMEISHEVIETSRVFLKKAEDVMIKHWAILQRKNAKRSVVPNIIIFMFFLFMKFRSVEPLMRNESIKFLKSLIEKSPPTLYQGKQIPNTCKGWIRDFYSKRIDGQ